jgi:predicted RND superfamily exporter protein
LSSYVVVEWPEQHKLSSHQVLQAVADVHTILGDERDLGSPFSVLNVLAALPHRRGQLAGAVPYLSRVPPELRATLVQPDLRKVAVRVQTPDSGCRALKPVFERIEAKVQALLREKHAGFRISLTGSPVVAARNIRLVIVDLCRSLTLASVIIFGVMTIVFRSVRRGLISVLPNAFPLAAAAALLVFLRDSALEMSSVITFSVCLGIAVDDTIHFISRFDRELKAGREVPEAVQQSVAKVGAALVVTTLTLLGGFGAGVFSELPALRSFAVLSCAALTAALFADVLILPALLVWFGQSRREQGPKSPSASSD